MELETNPDDILFGIHFLNYEDELGNEGKCLTLGFVLFNINFYL
jgi:hypothetical protein